MLETEMQKLFKRKVNQNADALPRTVDADIAFTGAPYIMHKQIQLDDNFKTYHEGTCNPSVCLEQELNQHLIKNRLSLSAVLNLA